MKRKQWIVNSGKKELAAAAARQFDIDPFAAMILSARGFDNINEIGAFFCDELRLTLDPFSIKDMDKAAKRITEAIDNFEMICVFGDYDADGVTATALLYSYLESRGANVISYIPDRIDEGYGLNFSAIEELHDRGVKLIVTVDNGVSAIEETAFARKLGVDVVITDHHMTGETLPDCCAVADPHRPDCPSTFKEMSGVGVAFKLACAIEGGDYEELLDEYAGLIAIGTIGDVVSLTGENRVMVKKGIENISSNPGIGIAALLEQSGIRDKKITSSTAAYTLCPRINASGRMGSAEKALELLLCDDSESGELLAQEITSMNARRQVTENEIFNEALKQLEEHPEYLKSKIIVVDGEGWHQGVIGIVAAKLTERFGRPSVVISVGPGSAKGSARSIEGFSIFEAIESVSDLLTHYGGHTLAAGVGLEPQNIPAFRKAINDYAAGREMPFAVQRIDCRLQLTSVSPALLDGIESLEPFGSGNPRPCFGLFGVTLEDVSPVSNGRHTRLVISKGGTKIGAVYFNMPDRSFPYEKGDTVDLAVNLESNFYNGETRVSVLVRGVRPGSTDESKVLESISLYNRFDFGADLTPAEALRLIPARETQVEVFRSIKAKPLRGGDCEQLCVRLGDDGGSLGKYMICVDIMTEMGIFTSDESGTISVPDSPAKTNLEESVIMKKLKSFLRTV